MDRRSLLKSLAAAPFGAALAACTARTTSARTAVAAAPPAPTPAAASPPSSNVVTHPAALASRTKKAGALRVLCVGAHPDDPECGCGGTLARLSKAGHDVTILYMTRGENDGGGRSFTENGKIRTREAETACKILGASPRFLGMRGGECEITTRWRKAMAAVFDELTPDLVFAQWPLDTNPDHQIAAMLAVQAYFEKSIQNPLYFFEVETGRQTVGFEPHVYVEIGGVLQVKNDAIMAHVSQSPERMYEVHHEPMERFRAREIGAVAAEAFAMIPGTLSTGLLPGL